MAFMPLVAPCLPSEHFRQAIALDPGNEFAVKSALTNDAVKTSKFDRMNRIYRMGKNIDMRNSTSPFGDWFWVGNVSCSSCKSCLNVCSFQTCICMVPAKAVVSRESTTDIVER
jgi:hypothetical protein